MNSLLRTTWVVGLLMKGMTAAGSLSAATTYYVSKSGKDSNPGSISAPFRTIQKGLNVALAGDTVSVRKGNYNEQVVPPRSGTLKAPIKLKSEEGLGSVTVDGTGLSLDGQGLLFIKNLSHFRIEGLHFTNVSGSDTSGIRLVGSGDGVQVEWCNISEIRGYSAMGVTAYATTTTPISNFLLRKCRIWNCDPSPSESVALNGRIEAAQIVDNHIHDCNNIGIDLIGGETSINRDREAAARNCLVKNNLVEDCHSPDGSAVGIYIDGGDYNIIEGNVIRSCDTGIQVGAENYGVVAAGNVVRNNIIAKNEQSGIILGSEDDGHGRATGTLIAHNLFYKNDTLNVWSPEVLIEWGSGHMLRYNIFYLHSGTPTAIYWPDPDSGGSHSCLGNVWWGAAEINFNWDGHEWPTYARFVKWERQDSGGMQVDPKLIDPENGNFHLQQNDPATTADESSPCINKVTGDFTDMTDMDGTGRKYGPAADIGPDEAWPVDTWAQKKFPFHLLYGPLLNGDDDNDGASNLVEYAAGSDPLKGTSLPLVIFTTKRSANQIYPVINWRFTRTAKDVVFSIITNDGVSSDWKDASSDFAPAIKIATNTSGGYDTWSRQALKPITQTNCQCVLKMEAKLVSP